jgi:excinuclease UvrABC nuclease subunit
MNVKHILDFTEIPNNESHAVYRFYNSFDELIYVGVSVDVLMRIAQHRRDKEWANEICEVELEWFSTRSEAISTENNLIKTLKPFYNLRLPREPKLCEFCNQHEAVTQ